MLKLYKDSELGFFLTEKKLFFLFFFVEHAKLAGGEHSLHYHSIKFKKKLKVCVFFLRLLTRVLGKMIIICYLALTLITILILGRFL